MDFVKLSPADQRPSHTGDCEICGPVTTRLAIIHREMIIRGDRIMVYAKLCPAHFIKTKDDSQSFILGEMKDDAKAIYTAIERAPEIVDMLLDLNLNKESLERLKQAFENFEKNYEADGSTNTDELRSVLETAEQGEDNG